MLVSHMRLGPAALRAGGLLKELLQVGAQEVLQRLKLGVRDFCFCCDAGEHEGRRAALLLLSIVIVEVQTF
jgi:hypothetical protein